MADKGLTVSNITLDSHADPYTAALYSQDEQGKLKFAVLRGREQRFNLEYKPVEGEEQLVLELDKKSKYSSTIIDILTKLDMVEGESDLDKVSDIYVLNVKNDPEAVLKAIYWAPEIKKKGRNGLRKFNKVYQVAENNQTMEKLGDAAKKYA